MMNNLLEFKAGIVAVSTAFATAFGWQGKMALIWVCVMMLDYITGTMAARKNGEWTSKAARNGIWHKLSMVVVIIVCIVADMMFTMLLKNVSSNFNWPMLITPVVMSWYILTELGSNLENAIKMGANVPKWLVKLLNQSIDVVDDIGCALPKKDTDTPVKHPCDKDT